MTITVITAPASTRLITLAKVKTALGITTSTDNALMNDIIDRVSQAIVDYCGRPFAQTEVTETLAGKGGIYLTLSNAPITTLASMKYNGELIASTLYSTQQIVDGFVFKKTGWIYTSHEYLYEAAYTYGYVLESFASGTPTLPLSIEQAALSGVTSAYQGRKTDSNIASEAVPDVYSVKYQTADLLGSGVTPVMKPLLDPYRRFKL